MDIKTPISEEVINKLSIRDKIYISGEIFCGRDAVLPKIVPLLNNGIIENLKVDLNGQVIFHTAVSRAGVGPTSSNKLEIETSIVPLSENGVKIHLGKGKLSKSTVEGLAKNKSIYAVVPPITALLNSCINEIKIVAFEDLGMEAFYVVRVENFPAIVAAVDGRSIYD